MAVTKEILKREFVFKKGGDTIVLPEIDSSKTPEQHLKFYATQYPELAIGSVKFKEVANGRARYEISATPGERG